MNVFDASGLEMVFRENRILETISEYVEAGLSPFRATGMVFREQMGLDYLNLVYYVEIRNLPDVEVKVKFEPREIDSWALWEYPYQVGIRLRDELIRVLPHIEPEPNHILGEN